MSLEVIDKALELLSARSPERLAASLPAGLSAVSPRELSASVEKIHALAPTLRPLYEDRASRPYVLSIRSLVEQMTGLVQTHSRERLDLWGTQSYASKARPFHLAAKLFDESGHDGMAWLDRESSLSQLLVWNAVRPLLETSQLDSLRTGALPGYLATLRYANEVFGVTRLKDFAATPERVRIALRLFVESLRSLEREATADADRKGLSELIALSGKALAAPDDKHALKRCAESARKASELIARVSIHPRLQPVGAFTGTLIEYLAP